MEKFQSVMSSIRNGLALTAREFHFLDCSERFKRYVFCRPHLLLTRILLLRDRESRALSQVERGDVNLFFVSRLDFIVPT